MICQSREGGCDNVMCPVSVIHKASSKMPSFSPSLHLKFEDLTFVRDPLELVISIL